MVTKVVAATLIATLNWSTLPRKEVVVTGKNKYTVKIKTTNSETYKGYFGAVATSTTGHLTRRLWFSETEDGKPMEQFYRPGRNACDVKGVEIKLSWTQESKPLMVTSCKLERNKEYYLNHASYSFGDGAEPTSKSNMIRSSSVSGKP